MFVRLIILFVFISFIHTKGQSLVVNGDFEKFEILPLSFSSRSSDFRLPGWSSPSYGTPDYFNTKSIGLAGLPKNWAGITFAHSGNGCAGLIATSPSANHKKNSYREYIQGSLTSPLKAGVEYTLEFYFKLSSNSLFSSDRIGAYFVDSLMKIEHDNLIDAQPTLTIVRPPLEAGGWESCKFKYLAKGGESYFIIGNFFDDNQTQTTALDFRRGRPDIQSFSYYYIDDVTLQPVVQSEHNSPPKDDLNDQTMCVYFKFNSWDLQPVAKRSLDSLVSSIVKKGREIVIEITGYADEVGHEDYNLTLSTKRGEEVKKYLLLQAIDEKKMSVFGAGEYMLKDISSNANGRRVDIRILKE